MGGAFPTGAAGGAGKRSVARAAAVCSALLGCLTANAESWTNVAGRAIEAQFVECAGRTVVLRQADGSRIRVPLASLCESDRRRIAARLPSASDGCRPTSPSAPAVGAENRAKALHDAGRLSDADTARVLQALKTDARDTPP